MAEDYFLRKRDAGFKSYVQTYTSLIMVNEMNPERCAELFNLMMDDGTKPDIMIYRMMKSVFAKAGDREYAEYFFKEIKDVGAKPPAGRTDWLDWFQKSYWKRVE
jgi:pentatricopeptide repeat protein